MTMMMTRQMGLPGLGADESKLSREKLLLKWFADRGLKLTEEVAAIMGGVHRTYPGKCLIKCCDELTDEMRKRLLAYGVPDKLLPPPPPPKPTYQRPVRGPQTNPYAL